MMLNYEVKKFGESTASLHKKLDVVDEATTRLIEDIYSFKKYYMVGLHNKAKVDAQVFTKA